MPIRLRIAHPSAKVETSVWYVFRTDRIDPEKISSDTNWIDLNDVESVDHVVVDLDEPIQEGHWKTMFRAPRSSTREVLKPLPSDGAIRWWHKLHGVEHSDLDRGRGAVVGVIDEALAPQMTGSGIEHIRNHGDVALGLPNSTRRAWEPQTNHSQAVVSLIASKSTNVDATQGMAPGAELHFCSAASDDSACLDIGHVTRCIDFLVDTANCHLISVSAGDCEMELPAIEDAVERAWDNGCLCFFAAGNEPREPRYPAQYDKCLAVTAIGSRDYAPPGTFECLHDRISTLTIQIDGSDFYLWHEAARGRGTDFAAAGSNVIWSINAHSCAAETGTSFASPVSVGAAAVILSSHPSVLTSPPSPERSQEMIGILTESCYSAQHSQLGVNYGILKV